MTVDRIAEAARKHWTLDPEVTFLNHGSFGACPRPVLEAQDRWRARFEREPVRFFARDLEPALDAAREVVAGFVHADPADLAFVPNATTGVNAVVRSLDLRPGDEVLSTNHVYNACRNALVEAAARAGARAVFAPVPFPLRGDDDVLEALLAHATPRTRLVLVDHVTSPTGCLFPVKRIVDAFATRGVDVLVDGAHGPGMLPLDLTALGAAYYTGNFHKWVCAPKGAAMLHVRRDRQERIRPPVISHGANTPRPGRSRFRLEFDWVGTDDPSAYLSVPEAIRFLGGLLPGGWPALFEHNRSTALAERRRLADRLGVALPCPDAMIGTLATLALPDSPHPGVSPRTADPLHDVLEDRHRVQVPIVIWPDGPTRWVRISAQVYNDPSQYARLADVLLAELAAERRSAPSLARS